MNNVGDNKKLLLLRLAMLIAIIGNGITWTGIGFYLSNEFHSPSLMALMQACSTAASLAGPLFVPFIPKKWLGWPLLVALDLACGFCYLIMFGFLDHADSMYVIGIIVFVLFVTMLLGAVQSLCFEPLYADEVVQEQAPKRSFLMRNFALLGSYVTTGKLIGMGCGPLISEGFGASFLIINTCTSIISALLIRLAFKGQINALIKQVVQQRINFQEIRNPVFMEGVIATSLIYVVVIMLSIRLMSLDPSSLEVSIYWLVATLSALSVQVIISKSEQANRLLQKWDLKMGYMAVIPIGAAFLIQNPAFVIVCQAVFSFMNPIARNSARAKFYQHFGEKEERIVIYASRDFLAQLVIFFVSITSLFFATSDMFRIVIAIIIVALIICRWILAQLKGNPEDVIITSRSN